MILYNVTVKIDQNVEQDWIKWMKQVHIPEILDTGLFLEYKFCKIVFPVEDDGSTTYAIQYFCKTMDDLNNYQSKFAKSLQAKHEQRYLNRYVAIRTLMEVL